MERAMTTGTESSGHIDAARIRACLEKMLATDIFSQAERQRRLLSYLVSETLDGRGGRLKGYSIAMAVFDRGADFDPSTEPIVRVEAARLRSKLREYYEREGRGDPLRIEIPKGSYAVQIGASKIEKPREAPSREDKPTIAVLPFANLGDDPSQAYFADGIAEDLTTDLSKLSGLVVISRHSSFLYRRSSKPASEIAKELGVRYLLEGSVRRADTRVRIGANLIDTATGAQIWAERYDRELSDIFAVQDDVARRILSSLKVKLVGAESGRLGSDGAISAEAHDQLLRGLERLWQYERSAVEESLQFFNEAIRIDPHYAPAHAYLARALMFLWALSYAADDMRDLAFRHAQQAVALDEEFPMGRAVLGWIHLWRREGDEALDAGRHAVALDPNNADARLFLSITLSGLGRGQEGMSYIRSAIRLNPHPSALHLMALGANYFILGQFEDAAEAFRQGTALRPGFTPNYQLLAQSLLRLGRRREALDAWRKCLSVSKDRPNLNFTIAEPWRSEYQADLETLQKLDQC
jgi:TolB-like protein/Tfp pilus assembly protein PilF